MKKRALTALRLNRETVRTLDSMSRVGGGATLASCVEACPPHSARLSCEVLCPRGPLPTRNADC